MVHVEVGEPYCIPLDQRIYVLEDVDCQSDLVLQRNESTASPTLNKSGEGDVHKIDLSFLLNLLDGVLEMPGRIVIMTSNFPDLLDTALVRPGRIDIIAKFTCCSFDTVIKMLEFFYDTSLTDEQRESIRETGEFKITPAEMSRIMFENFANIDGAIAKYKDFSGALDKQQQVDSPHDNSASEVEDATISTVGATASTVGATVSTVDAIASTGGATVSTVDAIASTEFYQKYLDSRETADEFAKRFVKNDDGTLTDVGATVSTVGATASTVGATASNDELYHKYLDERFAKRISKDRTAEESYEKLINKTNLKRLCGTIEEYEKYLPDYFNDNKHILCSPLPLECILKPSQETYSTLDTGVFSGASAFE
jgi:hypothetical protein